MALDYEKFEPFTHSRSGRAQEAYAQGFISKDEKKAIERGKYFISDRGNLVNSATRRLVPLTGARMTKLKANELLGLPYTTPFV